VCFLIFILDTGSIKSSAFKTASFIFRQSVTILCQFGTRNQACVHIICQHITKYPLSRYIN
jgi:hypothetical protein